ncbi:hypothetical protein A2715_05610 [Candidatus Woesebacteria bacterium RIFCSPHIGHO2_01_FULL_39_32]|uniref:Uncharacterized protein n=1 Tax=Candidatus Woesebacteria bacterium RIFCSPLOWO2_01_FULL_39_25 TaxID=1802521 RepID=A0A1F8BLT6_9BACT|nr:MAG: hypothetical protein A2124_04055 [Candidatus Woesebacteria bacterium GWB1_37_5]OGM25496.1 MAG: hypothetical protein A2715_05610 [Candidatus Woesebacteria bacterium RIFCSPHIGHO2_01_FULL_39_32]OGM36776.1 MAG: hypothetical protein A3F01_00080 [Candidatus Woesebacteria bacterium RIFCSPHIGHO2_12_FULL_38_11]OGM65027.1 MAG: hypothetical protein A2893_05220 [Candidatus Woesebacteria bacterium RIFCSPLOWO2_01_FULL_39_25]
MLKIRRVFLSFKKFLPKNFRKAFLLLYIFGLVLGLILTLVYAFVPSFVTCASFFAENFCTPAGIFLILALSLPGYLVAGNILALLPEIPWVPSLIIVIVTSGAFYFLIGLLIDKKRRKKISVSGINKLVIYLSFGLLLLFLISLLQAII